jgi:hypothetical protein
MKTSAYTRFVNAAALLALLALTGCGPAGEPISAAQAQQPVSNAVAYPEVAEGAGDGQVYEYH